MRYIPEPYISYSTLSSYNSIKSIPYDLRLYCLCVQSMQSNQTKKILSSSDIYKNINGFVPIYKKLASKGNLTFPRIYNSYTKLKVFEENPGSFMRLFKTQAKNKFPSEIIQIIYDHADGFNSGRCLYCCISSIAAMDHYLPKGGYKDVYLDHHFPWFSVLPINLVPICTTCNSIKGDLIGDDTAGNIFFHPYYSKVLDEKFLECNVSDTSSGLSFSFIKQYPSGWSYRLKSRFDETLKKLDLIARFSTHANVIIKSYLPRFHRYHLKKTLYSELLSLRSDFNILHGANNWETLMIESLINNFSVFSNYLDAKYSKYYIKKFIAPDDIHKI